MWLTDRVQIMPPVDSAAPALMQVGKRGCPRPEARGLKSQADGDLARAASTAFLLQSDLEGCSQFDSCCLLAS